MRDFLSRTAAMPTRAGLAPLPSDHVCALLLVPGVSERVVVPAVARFVNIVGTADIYVRFGGADVVAAVPGDVADGTAPTLNPATRQLPDTVTHIAAISEVAARVTLEFWG
ncbi:hypothetical protein [Xanthobacter tagetidis]|uniref:Uncharacterized protein n=1 Tax=Xanthobacter tagetidis TaxID=60216 RepID=A0A3L7ALW5_9HYPH|nr:hypothetical protein [Xanthobacter tagetidis]MBB6308897.1 hypothetical protein [Xanthobacter tagetidis]RLP80591.1 hypothetical protein D9R14_05960 [Xanthobacter tagetidis]